MAYCLNGTKPLSEPVPAGCQKAPWGKFNEVVIQMLSFSLKVLYCINVVCKNLILTRSQCVKVPAIVIPVIVLASYWHGQLGTNYIYSS